ncbi:hypothetical protein [Bacillus sp. SG-1]|uniref:hypothetical protein n=1 Tax=Bacillus sp. SG-1 TaxID=161544 RepID=UPI0001544AC5|nr:hypothetical protein [Bacillus sp. SG-1]EDL64091.1 hypothetical protein BSG1_13006 [Bacillus sp. SG-1]
MRKVEAYFQSEAEAESAKNKLKSISVEDGLLENVPGGRNISEIAGDLFSGEKHDGSHKLSFQVSEENHHRAHSIVKEHNGRLA